MQGQTRAAGLLESKLTGIILGSNQVTIIPTRGKT